MAGGLGRLKVDDSRDADFPLRQIMRVAPTTPPTQLPPWREWSTKTALDQGNTPMCVGFSSRQWISSSPVPIKGGPDAATIYHQAQVLDEIPGEDYEGTTARGAMKFLQAQGIASAYHWAETVEDAVVFLLTQGTLLLGTNWYTGMDQPDKDGVVRATGSVRGGHEILIKGAHQKRGMVRLLNSWGRAYGLNGAVWLPLEDLRKLLNEGGDICAPTQVAVTR